MNPKKNPVGQSAPVVRPPNQPSVIPPRPGADESLPDDVFPLRLKRVAELTGRSEKTVRRWIQAGLLPSHKLGGLRSIKPRDLRRFLDQQAGETNKERP